ncbi:metal-dependent transcriptional regulator [Microbacterium sp. 18062]|uniref:metal-dependent transcriptional regulator n=1 Tax=Microbacterium sp. 18062 TaxID=2681410 RepID=UPI00135990C2|nr:metal-dependent transcriptional regulator [Microbacterium sp. 18062]
MPDLINVIEMYLKSVLEMQEAGMPKRRVHISKRLRQSGPTVTKTVRRMERDGLVSFSSDDKKLAFTPQGFQGALRVMRKHRLAECFLDTVVGLDWTLVHEEACRWEHVMSDLVTERIDESLGHPERSPYGNPIPSAGATRWDPLEDRPEVSNLMRFLHDAGSEREASIAWIGEAVQAEPQLLGQLRTAGAVPGARVIASLHGSSVLLHDAASDALLELQHPTAAQLFVRP